MKTLVLSILIFILTVSGLNAHSSHKLGSMDVPSATVDTSPFITLPQLSIFMASVPNDYIGTYTVNSLPDPNVNAGKRALVTDLGGGPGYLRASNGCWKRVATTTASIQNLTVSTNIAIDGLLTSPIVGLAGSGFSGKATITITNACSIPQLTIVAPSGVFSTLGSLGLVIAANNNSVAVAGIGTSGTWNDFAIAPDGSTMTKIRGGSL